MACSSTISRIAAWRSLLFAITPPKGRAQDSMGRLHRKAAIDALMLHYYAFDVNKIPVGVLGGSGYAGRELCALILRHPELELAFATANEQRGASARVAGSTIQF